MMSGWCIYEGNDHTSRYYQLEVESDFPHQNFSEKLSKSKDGGSSTFSSTTNKINHMDLICMISPCCVTSFKMKLSENY